MPSRLDSRNAFAVVHCYPTGHVEPRLIRWLNENGIGWDAIAFSNVRMIPRAYNQGVRQALASGRRELIFADNDIIPSSANGNRPGTNDFLTVTDADVVCCPCELGIPGAWARPETFHCGLWRTTREALLRVSPPWFLEKYDADGTELEQCVCAYFAAKARAAGLTIVRAGWADHRVKT